MSLGHYPTTQKELNEICSAQFTSFADNIQISSGNGIQMQQKCTPTENGIAKCSTNTDPITYDANFGVDVFASFVNVQRYLVATDNKTYKITYFCIDGFHASFQLRTTTPYASPEAVEAYVETAKKYGILLDQLILLQCDSAYNGPYPYPFQNYPNGWSSGNGWSNNSTGWGTGPLNGWNQNPPSNGWNSNPPSNGWNSNPPSNGWNSQPIGWSNINSNGWLVEKQAEVKAESQTAPEAKSDPKNI